MKTAKQLKEETKQVANNYLRNRRQEIIETMERAKDKCYSHAIFERGSIPNEVELELREKGYVIDMKSRTIIVRWY